MIYRNRSRYTRLAGGFMRFRSADRQTFYGYGEGDYVRLRDEFGGVWVGSVTREENDLVRYRFRDEHGRYVTGVSDSYGVVLRDDKGKTWRGFID
jgi:hypothetical protein